MIVVTIHLKSPSNTEPLTFQADRLSSSGDRLVVHQSAEQNPQVPFVSLDHCAAILTTDLEVDQLDISEVIPATFYLRDGRTFSLLVTEVSIDEHGRPFWVEPKSSPVELVYVDEGEIAAVTTSVIENLVGQKAVNKIKRTHERRDETAITPDNYEGVHRDGA